MVLPPGMLEHNLQSNHDLDCVFQSPDGFLYVQGFRRDSVVQHIQDRVGPLPRLGWVADPDAASPITGIRPSASPLSARFSCATSLRCSSRFTFHLRPSPTAASPPLAQNPAAQPDALAVTGSPRPP